MLNCEISQKIFVCRLSLGNLFCNEIVFISKTMKHLIFLKQSSLNCIFEEKSSKNDYLLPRVPYLQQVYYLSSCSFAIFSIYKSPNNSNNNKLFVMLCQLFETGQVLMTQHLAFFQSCVLDRTFQYRHKHRPVHLNPATSGMHFHDLNEQNRFNDQNYKTTFALR